MHLRRREGPAPPTETVNSHPDGLLRALVSALRKARAALTQPPRGRWGGGGGRLLSQVLEAFQEMPRRAVVFGSQRHHQEVEVVEQGHVIVSVRSRHLEQLSPAVFDAHAWHGGAKEKDEGIQQAS